MRVMASGFEVVSQPVAVRSNLPIKVEIKLAVAGSKTFGRSQPQAYLSRARLIQLGHHNRYFSLFKFNETGETSRAHLSN
jgi:hypothetical protein